ncbi:MAG: hypothetical protein JSS95_10350 [Acidobacteria bacterium]|nr:hypothetical protein [Acidobacteriota bacterium]
MKSIAHTDIELSASEAELLLNAIPNELINGFELNNFESTIGIGIDQLKSISENFQDFSKSNKFVVHCSEARSLKNALAAVLNELGIEEFQTRTGFEHDEAQRLLGDMERILTENNKEGAR